MQIYLLWWKAAQWLHGGRGWTGVWVRRNGLQTAPETLLGDEYFNDFNDGNNFVSA